MTSTALLFAVFIYAQGKNGVTQTAQAESTPVVAVSTAVADSGAATVESKTVKTEIQSPGVVTEYKEDGTKVVTINLSEVDENKLQERYEAKVILEVPIYDMADIKDNKLNIADKVFFADAIDAIPRMYFDVKVDEKGKIYVFEPYAERIQMFNQDGKRIKIIPVKNVVGKITFDEINPDRFKVEGIKDEFVVGGGNIYLRDTIKNKIEKMDETGKVFETVEIPEKIDGKETRYMKMWADESGVGVDVKKKIQKTVTVQEIDKRTLYIQSEKQRILINQGTRDAVWYSPKTRGDSIFVSSEGKRGVESGFVKISINGNVLAMVRDWKYIFSDEWKDECGNGPQPLMRSWEQSMPVDSKGNLYFLQTICCKNTLNCERKIRIIKLKTIKAKE